MRHPERRCAYCGRPFHPFHARDRYHNPRCARLGRLAVRRAQPKRFVPHPRQCANPACRLTFVALTRHHRFHAVSCRPTYRPRRLLKDTLAPGVAPLCACGQPLRFTTDALIGITLEVCAVCGPRPMALRGSRHYNQRQAIEDELQGFVDRAQRAVKPRKVPAIPAGQHWRRLTHEYRRTVLP